jgi:hypothetical protein
MSLKRVFYSNDIQVPKIFNKEGIVVARIFTELQHSRGYHGTYNVDHRLHSRHMEKRNS